MAREPIANLFRRVVDIEGADGNKDTFLVRVDNYPNRRIIKTCVCRAATCNGCDGSACVAYRDTDYYWTDVQTIDTASDKAIAYAHGAMDAMEAIVPIMGGAFVYQGQPHEPIGSPEPVCAPGCKPKS